MNETFVALDLETTGLDPERDAIWEIGVVVFQLPPFPESDPAQAKVLERWETRVNPGRPISLKNQQLSGIGGDELRGEPSFRKVLPTLRRLLADHPIVGHSIHVDLAFLHSHECIVDNPMLDTFELAGILLPNQSRYDLATLAAAQGITVNESHRALQDAETARDLFLALFDTGCRLPPHLLMEINRLALGTPRWALRELFQEFERRAVVHGPRPPRRVPATGGEAGPLYATLAEDRPLRPREPALPIDGAALAKRLEPDGALAAALPGYEFRQPQVEMLRAVADALNHGEHLLVEAGTGTGKSLAYLLPAAEYATLNDTRVIVSTNTINLQDQLWLKDLPMLALVSRKDLRVALLKGRTNYLCPRRLNALRNARTIGEDELRVLAKILVWLPTTRMGDQAELFLPTGKDWAVWNKVAVDPEACTAERCQREQGGRCFFHQARRQAERAHIVVVNHALLLADVATENRVLPEYRHLIIDEAHHLEDAVTDQLSFSVDRDGMASFLASLYPPGSAVPGGLLGDVLTRCKPALPDGAFETIGVQVQRLRSDIDHAATRLQAFFDELASFVATHDANPHSEGYDRRMRILPPNRSQPAWSNVELTWENVAVFLRRLGEALRRLRGTLADLGAYDIEDVDGLLTDLDAALVRMEQMVTQIEALVHAPTSESIYWVEVSSRNERVTLRVAPLHVGPLLEEHLWDKNETVILTSATLRTGDSFDYVRSRLNAQHTKTLTVGSPFDYEASTLLCVPSDMPEPNAPGYQQAVEQVLVALCKAMGGRTLALFTSYNQLRKTSQVITPPLAEEGIVVYEQGEGASRRQLLQNFRTTERAVLLGTRSFWEGVDVVGEALSCLVIVRLPFAVPSDPVFAARAEAMSDPFNQYTVPDAILRFRQGFGRLIRSKSDTGVVVVLDSRVQTKNYGRLFIRSLPECTTRYVPWRQVATLAGRWMQRAGKREGG